MMRILPFAVATVAATISGVAAAKTPEFVSSTAVADKPTVQLDPAKAYVLLRSAQQSPLYLMKMPSDEDRVIYDRLRAEALAEARRKYAGKLASYERARAAAAKMPKGGVQTAVPDKPMEPTEANFEFTPFDLLATVAIGPVNRFAKGPGGASTYLHALTPGRYRIYGPIMTATNNALAGTCYCMGSVSFEAKAGEIADISAVHAAGQGGDLALSGNGQPLLQAGGAPLDPRLAGATVRPAKFRPVGKIPNYFGLAIARLPAMAGVMRYDRDRIVDLSSGQ